MAAGSRLRAAKKRSFFYLCIEKIKNSQICAGIGKTELNILFQIGHIAKEAAASTLEFGNDENCITDASQGIKILLPGNGGTNRAHGAPGAQDQNAEEGFFVAQVISLIDAQKLFFGGGERTGIE